MGTAIAVFGTVCLILCMLAVTCLLIGGCVYLFNEMLKDIRGKGLFDK